MEGVVYHKKINLRRWRWKLLLLFSLLLYIMPVHSTSTLEVPEFPQGLILEFEVIQQAGFNTIHLNTHRFVFNNWIDRGSVFSLILFNDEGTHTLEVYLPEWRAVYTDDTEYGYLKPLWMNLTSWKLNDNVSIGSKGIFRLSSNTRTEDTDVGTYNCWVARKENSLTHRYEHYYYNLDHGALIGHWWTDMSGMSINSVNWKLVDTNLNTYDPVYRPLVSQLDVILLIGVAAELVIICVFIMKRRK
jgi:hypothetical protein